MGYLYVFIEMFIFYKMEYWFIISLKFLVLNLMVFINIFGSELE